MAENALEVEIRQDVGKGVARKLRAAGRIPGVCYGGGTGATSVVLDPKALRRLLERGDAGMNTLINLKAPGADALDGKMVLVRELQRDPVRGAYLHADLYAIDVTQRVEVSVPVHLVGKAMGIELGGIVDHALRELELECLPLNIPNEIEVDVSALDIGDSIHVRDIALPGGVELRSDPDLSVVSVVAPKAEEEETPTDEEAEALAEGEVPAEGEAAEKKEEGADSAEEKSD